jgi:hypothetical protein
MIAGQLEESPVRRDDMGERWTQGSNDLQVAMQRVIDVRELKALEKVHDVMKLLLRGQCERVLADDKHTVPDAKPASHPQEVSHKTEGAGMVLAINGQQRRLKEGLMRSFDHECGVDQKAVLWLHHSR